MFWWWFFNRKMIYLCLKIKSATIYPVNKEHEGDSLKGGVLHGSPLLRNVEDIDVRNFRQERFMWRHLRQWSKNFGFGSALFTQFWRCKYGFVYYSNVQQTFKDGKIKWTVFTRPHAMKRHKSISPMLRNRDLSFWTPVNFEVEYFLNEETEVVLTDTVILWYYVILWSAPNLAISTQT